MVWVNPLLIHKLEAERWGWKRLRSSSDKGLNPNT